MEAPAMVARPLYGPSCVEEQHCFDCDMELTTSECTEPLCSGAAGSVVAAAMPGSSSASALASSSNGFAGHSVTLTSQCTPDCFVVTCDDPDHAESICGEQGPHSGHCDLGCDAAIDCTACHGFDHFLRCCDNYPALQSGTLPQNQRLTQHPAASNPTQSSPWDSTFGDFAAWCDCTLKAQPAEKAAGHGVHVQQHPQQHYTDTPALHRPSTLSAHQQPGSSMTPNGVNMNSIAYPPPQHQLENGSCQLDGYAYTRSHMDPQSPLDPPQNNAAFGPFSCMWADCHASYFALADLVAHVNVQHLVTSSSSLNMSLGDNTSLHVSGTAGGVNNIGNHSAANMPYGRDTHDVRPHEASTSSVARSRPSVSPQLTAAAIKTPTSETEATSEQEGQQNHLSCLWANCTNADAASFDVLAYHLFHEHLGIQPPPSVFSNTVSNGRSFEQQQHNQYQRLYNMSMSPSNTRTTLEQTPTPVMRPNVVNTHSAQSSGNGIQAPGSLMYSPTTTTISSGSLTPPNATEEDHNCSDAHHECKWVSCGLTFPSCDELTLHINADHVGSGKAKYECFWEGCIRNGAQGFMSKQKICRHVQSHTGHRPFQCDICQQHFSEAATLQQHIRRHTQEKPYVCDFPGCGKSFAITGALTIHKRTHNGDKPFKCTYCDRGFAESSNLSKHLRTHTGARPYACPEPGCGKTFARPDQLNRHKSVHQRQLRGSTAQN